MVLSKIPIGARFVSTKVLAEICFRHSRTSVADWLDLYGGREPLGILVCGFIRQRSTLAGMAKVAVACPSRRDSVLARIALYRERSPQQARKCHERFDG